MRSVQDIKNEGAACITGEELSALIDVVDEAKQLVDSEPDNRYPGLERTLAVFDPPTSQHNQNVWNPDDMRDPDASCEEADLPAGERP